MNPCAGPPEASIRGQRLGPHRPRSGGSRTASCGQNLDSARSGVAELVRHLRTTRANVSARRCCRRPLMAPSRTTPTHHRLAAVVEMIHTASLADDDVLDVANPSRGNPPRRQKLRQTPDRGNACLLKICGGSSPADRTFCDSSLRPGRFARMPLRSPELPQKS